MKINLNYMLMFSIIVMFIYGCNKLEVNNNVSNNSNISNTTITSDDKSAVKSEILELDDIEIGENKKGFILEKRYLDANGELSSITNYSYGNMKKNKINGYIRLGITKLPNNKIIQYEKCVFDNKNNLIEKKLYNGEKIKVSSITYKNNNGISEEIFETEGKKIINKTVYNDKIKIFEKKIFNDDKLEWVDEYSYNEKGDIIKEKSIDSFGKVRWELNISYNYDERGNKNEMLIKYNDGTSNIIKYKNDYDETRRIIQITEKYKNGDIKTIRKFNYKNTGELESEKLFDTFENEIGNVSYDKEGRLISKKRIENDESVSIWKEYTYDDKGNLIEEKSMDYSGDIVYTVKYIY